MFPATLCVGIVVIVDGGSVTSVTSCSTTSALMLLGSSASQVLKFSENGTQLQALGKALVPGHDTQHFCKPTAVSTRCMAACASDDCRDKNSALSWSPIKPPDAWSEPAPLDVMQVAFSRSGHFFVADGYCNSRVIRYSPDGTVIREYTLQVRCKARSHADRRAARRQARPCPLNYGKTFSGVGKHKWSGVVVSDNIVILLTTSSSPRPGLKPQPTMHRTLTKARKHAQKGQMNIPHSLVVDDCANTLYVADRESAAVQRFALEEGHHEGTVDLRRWGPVYAITMAPYGTLLALCWQQGGAEGGVSVVHINPYDGALRQQVGRGSDCRVEARTSSFMRRLA